MDQPWTKTITPRRGLLDIPLRELWAYRDLVWLMAKRNITAQYKQTVLGPAWFIIQPLLTTLVFSFLFGRVAGLGTDNVPHFLFYMSGLVLFNFMGECVAKTAVVFTRNSQLFGKVYFPRLAMPLSQTLTSLAAFGVQLAVLLVGYAFYFAKMKGWLWFAAPDPLVHLVPSWRLALLPVLLVMLTMLGLGVGFIIAALTTRYKDMQLAVGFGVQLWMYASSVVFPLSKITNPDHVALLKLNPAVPIIEGFRFALLGRGTVEQMDLVISGATCAAIFVIGLIMFSRTEQTVMDTV
jgi:lipopolysaccharide transport system permease protein